MGIVEQIRARIVAIGWSETARRSGVERSHLHHVFGTKPRQGASLRTVERVCPTLGLQLTLTEIQP